MCTILYLFLWGCLISCADALISLFLLSSAKEQQCVPGVSGRAAAVGNSRWVTLQPSSCSIWVMELWFLWKSLGEWFVCVYTNFLPRPTANPNFCLATVDLCKHSALKTLRGAAMLFTSNILLYYTIYYTVLPLQCWLGSRENHCGACES